MPSVFLDGVSKMVKNTGSVEIHGTQTGVTMVSSRSREAITNAVLNPKWLVVFQWTAKTFTFKISRIYPAILNRLFKIWNYNNVLYVFCTWNKQYTCRKFWTSCFFLHYDTFMMYCIHDFWIWPLHRAGWVELCKYLSSIDSSRSYLLNKSLDRLKLSMMALNLNGGSFRGVGNFIYSDHRNLLKPSYYEARRIIKEESQRKPLWWLFENLAWLIHSLCNIDLQFNF